MKSLLAAVFIVWAATMFAAETLPLAKAIDLALQKSQITLCNTSSVPTNNDANNECQPFHLKASVSEKDSPDSDYKADIEEHWMGPDKWSRQISTPDFAQKIVRNGDKHFESHTGDYEPHWLRSIVSALFDPLPMRDQLSQLVAQVQLRGDTHSEYNVRWQQKIGAGDAQNTAFSTISFRGDGLLTGIYTPGYGPTFKDFRAFGAKTVPRTIVFNPEPGTEIDVVITTLEKLSSPSEELFAIPQSAPAVEAIRTVQLSESTARSLIRNAPDTIWPPVRDGKTHGVLSLYISVDRGGKVRETFPMNSDNAQVDDSAREQISTWEFKTAAVENTPVQFESTITLLFDTKVGNPIPQLSDAEARKLATHIVEPEVPPGAAPGGTKFTVTVAVDETGKIMGVNNTDKLPMALFLAGYQAAGKWRFSPYVRNGKPDRFDAHITFTVPR